MSYMLNLEKIIAKNRMEGNWEARDMINLNEGPDWLIWRLENVEKPKNKFIRFTINI